MKVIIVDDEELAIQYIETALESIYDLEVIETFTSSKRALPGILLTKPDLIFLDIEMPEKSGLDLATEVRTKLPNVKIIFITSHEQYAMDVFDMEGIDYIMKPFEIERVIKAIDKITNNESKKSPAKKQRINCFGGLSFSENNLPVLDLKWRTKMAREIFSYFINHRNENVRKDVLLDMFWPDLDMKEGYSVLYPTIHYIRKTLKDIGFPLIIENTEDHYTLMMNGVMTDVDEWKLDPLEKIDLYKGHYFAEESYLWAEHERKMLRIKWLEVIQEKIEELFQAKECSRGLLYSLEFKNNEPYLEEPYFYLMMLFSQINDWQSVEHEYRELLNMLDDEYGIRPRNEIIEWYENWSRKLSKRSEKL